MKRSIVTRLVAIAILGSAAIAGTGLALAGGERPAPRPVFHPAAHAVVPAAKPLPKPIPAPAEPHATGYAIKRILPIDGPMKQGDWHWDESDIPAGPGIIIVTVDLAARTLSVFRDGYEIGATVIAFGTDDRPTPLGVFPVTQKDEHHVSNLYDAPMPYMLRMTNDGISIHGSKVGDEDTTWYTHGCVGVPLPFAKRLFAAVRLGDRVIVSRGETLKLGSAITAG